MKFSARAGARRARPDPYQSRAVDKRNAARTVTPQLLDPIWLEPANDMRGVAATNHHHGVTKSLELTNPLDAGARPAVLNALRILAEVRAEMDRDLLAARR